MFKSDSDFEKAIFKDLDYANESFETIDFESCSFTSCDFTEVTFLNCNFTDCYFEKCNMSNAKFPNSRLQNNKFQNCKMIGIDFTLLNSRLGLFLNCKNCDLSFTDFNSQDMKKSIFIDCTFVEAEFSNSICTGVNFEGSNLLRSVFSGTDLREASFLKAYDYIIDPGTNKVKDARFSRDQVTNLLIPFKIKIED